MGTTVFQSDTPVSITNQPLNGLSNTYWYLTGVPELMALAGSKFECFVEAAEADDE